MKGARRQQESKKNRESGLERAAETPLLNEYYSTESEKDLTALGTSIEKFKARSGSTIFMEGTKRKMLMAG